MRSDMIGIGVRRGRRARAKPMRMRFYVIGRLFGGPARAPQGARLFVPTVHVRTWTSIVLRKVVIFASAMCRSGLRFLVCAEQSQSEAHART